MEIEQMRKLSRLLAIKFQHLQPTSRLGHFSHRLVDMDVWETSIVLEVSSTARMKAS